MKSRFTFYFFIQNQHTVFEHKLVVLALNATNGNKTKPVEFSFSINTAGHFHRFN